jgi:hypothetical protein
MRVVLITPKLMGCKTAPSLPQKVVYTLQIILARLLVRTRRTIVQLITTNYFRLGIRLFKTLNAMELLQNPKLEFKEQLQMARQMIKQRS